MKRKQFICMLALVACSALQAQTNFRELTFAQALQAAAQEGKMVMIDCYTSWCGPCKMMAAKEFPKKEMGDYLNPKFVCMKMDMEKGEGPDMSKRYDVSCFPTFLFLDSKGELLFRMSGSMDTETFKQKTEAGLANTETGIAAMMKRYKNGERSEAFVKEYIDELRANMMQGEISKVVSEYLKGKTAADLAANQEYFDMFCNCIDQLDDPLFQTMYADKEVLIAKYGKKADDKFYNVLKNHPFHFATFDGKKLTSYDFNKLDEYVAKLKSEKVKEAEQIGAYYRYYVAFLEKNTDEAYKQAKIFSKYDIRDYWIYYSMLSELENAGKDVEPMAKKCIKALEKQKKALDSTDEKAIKRIDRQINQMNDLIASPKKD